MLYDDASTEVTLAPTFDLITTTAYLPHDSMALTLNGTKRWPEYKRVHRYGMERCRLAPNKARDIIAEVVEAVATDETALDKNSPSEDRGVALAMRTAWREGIRDLRK